MAAESEKISQCREKGNDKSGADEADANFGCDTEGLALPQGAHAEKTAQAENTQTDHAYDDLDKTDHRAAIHLKYIGSNSKDENDKSDEGDDQIQAYTTFKIVAI